MSTSAAAHTYHRLYNTARWRKRRARQLADSPLCVYCLARDVVTPATVADHVTPHKGDERLFWHGELQSLCKRCHDSEKQREERGLRRKGCDVDGWPFHEEDA
ncbi:HNH endonuclease [Kaustia mangrovi]|uniref:HNH endonuclease n=1 Tax=Kaustia mangrovi TaxID=2593653 RepID=A0A7S8HCD1_9HYPH|nr:HNH endonuclease [Kaustia mangrovi]QPC43501.1 HNH endonuclease [Kaustia mangrovi]